MGNVYSINMGQGQIGDLGYTVLGPAPAGTRWIVRDIELVNALLAPFPVQLSSGPVVGWYEPETEVITPWTFKSAAVVPTGQSIEWHGRQVCPDGWGVFLGGNMVDWYFSVSGYQLTLP